MPLYVVHRRAKPNGKKKKPVIRVLPIDPITEYPTWQEVDVLTPRSRAKATISPASMPTPQLLCESEPLINVLSVDVVGCAGSDQGSDTRSPANRSMRTPGGGNLGRTKSGLLRAMAYARLSPKAHDDEMDDLAKKREVQLSKHFSLSNLTLEKEGCRGGEAMMSLRAYDIARQAVDAMQRLIRSRSSSVGGYDSPVRSRLLKLGREAKSRHQDIAVGRRRRSLSQPNTDLPKPLLSPQAWDSAMLGFEQQKRTSLVAGSTAVPTSLAPPLPEAMQARTHPAHPAHTDAASVASLKRYEDVKAKVMAAEKALYSNAHALTAAGGAEGTTPTRRAYTESGGLRGGPQEGYVLADGAGTSSLPSYRVGVALPDASWADLAGVEHEERADIEGARFCEIERFAQEEADGRSVLPPPAVLSREKLAAHYRERQLALGYEEQLRRKTLAYDAQLELKNLLTYVRTSLPDMHDTVMRGFEGVEGISVAGLYAMEVRREYADPGVATNDVSKEDEIAALAAAAVRDSHFEKVFSLTFDESVARQRVMQDARDALRPIATDITSTAVQRSLPRDQLDLLRLAERMGVAVLGPHEGHHTLMTPASVGSVLTPPTASLSADVSPLGTGSTRPLDPSPAGYPHNHYPQGSIAKAFYETFYTLTFNERHARGEVEACEVSARTHLVTLWAEVPAGHRAAAGAARASAKRAQSTVLAQQALLDAVAAFEFEERFAREDLLDDEAYTRLAVAGATCPTRYERELARRANGAAPQVVAATTPTSAPAPAAARNVGAGADADAAYDRLMNGIFVTVIGENEARDRLARFVASERCEVELAERVASEFPWTFIQTLRRRKVFSPACEKVWAAREEADGRVMLALRIVVIDENETRNRLIRYTASDRYELDLAESVCRAFPVAFCNRIRRVFSPLTADVWDAYEEWDGRRMLARRVVVIDENESRNRLCQHVASERCERELAEDVCCRFPQAFVDRVRLLFTLAAPVQEVFDSAGVLRGRWETQRAAVERNPYDANELALALGPASREALFGDLHAIQFEERMMRQDIVDEYHSLQWTRDVAQHIAEGSPLAKKMPLKAWVSTTAADAGAVTLEVPLISAPVKRHSGKRAMFEELYSLEFQERMRRQDIWDDYMSNAWQRDLAAAVDAGFPCEFVEVVRNYLAPGAWVTAAQHMTPSDAADFELMPVPALNIQRRRPSVVAFYQAVHTVEFEERMRREDIWDAFVSRQWEGEVVHAVRAGFPTAFQDAVRNYFPPALWLADEIAASTQDREQLSLAKIPSPRKKKRLQGGSQLGARGDPTDTLETIEFEEKMARLDLLEAFNNRSWETALARDIRRVFPEAFQDRVRYVFPPNVWLGEDAAAMHGFGDEGATPLALPNRQQLRDRRRRKSRDPMDDPFVREVCTMEFEEKMARLDIFEEFMSRQWEAALAQQIRATFPGAFAERVRGIFPPNLWMPADEIAHAGPAGVVLATAGDGPAFVLPNTQKVARRKNQKRLRLSDAVVQQLCNLEFEEKMGRQDIFDDFMSGTWEKQLASAVRHEFPSLMIDVLERCFAPNIWLGAQLDAMQHVSHGIEPFALPATRKRGNKSQARNQSVVHDTAASPEAQAIHSLLFQEKMLRQDVWDEYASREWERGLAADVRAHFPIEFYSSVQRCFVPSMWMGVGETPVSAPLDVPEIMATPLRKPTKKRAPDNHPAGRLSPKHQKNRGNPFAQAYVQAMCDLQFEEKMLRQDVWDEYASREWERGLAADVRTRFPLAFYSDVQRCFVPSMWMGVGGTPGLAPLDVLEIMATPLRKPAKKRAYGDHPARRGSPKKGGAVDVQTLLALQFEEKMRRQDVWDAYTSREWERGLAADVRVQLPGEFCVRVQRCFAPSMWMGVEKLVAGPMEIVTIAATPLKRPPKKREWHPAERVSPRAAAGASHSATATAASHDTLSLQFEESVTRGDLEAEFASWRWAVPLAQSVKTTFPDAFVERVRGAFPRAVWHANAHTMGVVDPPTPPSLGLVASPLKYTSPNTREALAASTQPLEFEETLAREVVLDAFFSKEWELDVATALVAAYPPAFVDAVAPYFSQNIWARVDPALQSSAAAEAKRRQGMVLGQPRAKKRDRRAFEAVFALEFEEKMMRQDVHDAYFSAQWQRDVVCELVAAFPEGFAERVRAGFHPSVWEAAVGHKLATAESVELVASPLEYRRPKLSQKIFALEFEEKMTRRGVEEDFFSRQWECEVVDALRRELPPHVVEAFRGYFHVSVWLDDEITADIGGSLSRVVSFVPAPGRQRLLLKVILALEFEERMMRLDIIEEHASRAWEQPLAAAVRTHFPPAFADGVRRAFLPVHWVAAERGCGDIGDPLGASGAPTEVRLPKVTAVERRRKQSQDAAKAPPTSPPPPVAGAAAFVPSPPPQPRGHAVGAPVVRAHPSPPTRVAGGREFVPNRSTGSTTSMGISYSGTSTTAATTPQQQAGAGHGAAYLTLLTLVLDEEEERYNLETECDRAHGRIRGAETSTVLALGVKKKRDAASAVAGAQRDRLDSLEERLLQLKDDIPFPLVPLDAATTPPAAARNTVQENFTPTPPRGTGGGRGGSRGRPQPQQHVAPLQAYVGDHHAFLNRMLDTLVDRQVSQRQAIARAAQKERAEILSTERTAYLRCSLQVLPQLPTRPSSNASSGRRTQGAPSPQRSSANTRTSLPTI